MFKEVKAKSLKGLKEQLDYLRKNGWVQLESFGVTYDYQGVYTAMVGNDIELRRSVKRYDDTDLTLQVRTDNDMPSR